MQGNQHTYRKIVNELQAANAQLVAVSKLKSVNNILDLYHLGQKDFGENYVQELVEKQASLPADIRWHFIGHLQSNKVKYLAPFVHLIHSVDSLKLLKEINKQGEKANRVIQVLLQVHIARETTKFGWDESTLKDLISEDFEEFTQLKNVSVKGLMGMGSFSDDEQVVRSEFENLKNLYDVFKEKKAPNFHLEILSMGMSGDYQLALEYGSNMVRIGSLIFGNR